MNTQPHRPLILVSNDDGVDSCGIATLVDCLAGIDADVYVVAPLEQHSGQSSAITVNAALRIHELPDYNGARMFAVGGTPVDCVKLAVHTVLPRRPDFMFSGINHGSNSGNCAIYSGTMGAAMEACMYGVSAVAFSLLSHDPEADFSGVMPMVREIARKVVANGGLPKHICLNVNMPAACVPEGLKFVRAARGYWSEEYQRYDDPNGHPFYWLKGSFVNEEPEAPDTDEYWLARNFATVVPVRPDQSAVDALPAIASLLGGC